MLAARRTVAIIDDSSVRDQASSQRHSKAWARDLEWSVVRDRTVLGSLVGEWTQLYRASGTPNPFAHPAWVTTWLDHFTRERDLYERQHWDLGLGTQINLRCMHDAIERGDTVVNLSQNPDQKKMRWSEHIEVHNEFRIVSPRRGARLRTGLFMVRRAVKAALELRS
jgi:hypothetical protein